MMSKRRGRKPKLTNQTFDKAVRALASGQTKRATAAMVGIDPATRFVWLQKGQAQPNGLDHDFHEACKQALAAAEVRIVNGVHRSVEGAVFRLKVYDEEGQPVLNENTGKQKYKSVVILPDGRLGLRLLQLRNPDEWGGKGSPPLAAPAGSAIPTEAIISMFDAAVKVLYDSGAVPRSTLAPKQMNKDSRLDAHKLADDGAVDKRVGQLRMTLYVQFGTTSQRISQFSQMRFRVRKCLASRTVTLPTKRQLPVHAISRRVSDDP
jgi:hypothetical protein